MRSTAMYAKNTRVVIIGGGFGGLAAAKALKSCQAEVILIDRRNVHTFQPLLYQVATAGLSPANIATPLHSILNKQKNTSVMLAAVEDFDVDGKVVLTDRGPVYFDYLILAVGATNSWFGNHSWQLHANPLKSIKEAQRIRYTLIGNLERAEWTADEAERQKLMTIVVIGGGPTGVEMAGAVTEFLYKTSSHDFKKINMKQAKVIILQRGDRLLPGFHPSLSEQTRSDLERLGVSVITGAGVQSIEKNKVCYHHNDQDIEQTCGLIIWGAGVQASPLAAKLAKSAGVKPGRRGHIPVKNDCSVGQRQNVFAIGDCADFSVGLERPLPGVAQVALQQGTYVGKKINRIISKKKPKDAPFKYFDKGSMATIGKNRAVLESGWLRLSGWLAWMGWLVVHLQFNVSRQNRLLIVFQWFWACGGPKAAAPAS
jgi:NADH dehydrogenase